ncbi:cGMP-dependent protein kinase [Cymbomonas tetramitiformis]|uniref:cGMP-dependent protein kinase n=1 Tax=Cymbomonas tetramitiformis TaxID=36881 RepID=A0AAE0L254_9CHLO|nr:cGMP-dependent protein kinase [Cymbomonas tetramitiformis]
MGDTADVVIPANKGKRQAVAAQATAAKTEEIKYIAKTKTTEALILRALEGNPLFEDLVTELGDLGLGAFSDLTTSLIGSMTKMEVAAGGKIIEEGAHSGDKFYVVEKGSCAIKKKEKEVGTLQAGFGFGELALLYNCPRNATVEATEACILWVLDQAVYNALKRTHAEKLLKEKMELVDSVPSFKVITGEHRAQLADSLEPMTFQENEFIVREGEVGDRFYIVQVGEVAVETAGMELVRLVAGAFFGERALINDDVRQADVRVVSHMCTCLTLNRQAFLDLLGPMEQAWRWDCLRQVTLLAPLTDSQITSLSDGLKPVEFAADQVIFEKGSTGDCLFILESGALQVFDGTVDANELATISKRGAFFGEMALLNSEPRMATVVCKEKAKCLELSREVLEGTVGNLASLRLAWQEDTLRRVPLLSKLTADQRTKLAKGLMIKSFNDGEYVIRQGDQGSSFFILERGQVEVKDGQQTLKTLDPGAYFGELALLKNDVRAMNIVCKGSATVAEVTRDEFVALLGPLQTILDEQMESYDSVGQKIEIKSLTELEQKAVLGMGAFGKVLLVGHDSKFYALKCFVKQQILAVGLQNHLMQERNIMMDCNSHFLVNLVGTFQDDDQLYMIMETVMGGELFTHLQNSPNMRVPELAAKFYAACTVMAFEYLHDRHYCHRDLKPENLLIDNDGYLKLADFGFAKKLKNGEKTYTTCGTPDYMAPELLTQQGHTGAVDWWALGILIYEMTTGTTPFYADDEIQRFKLIQKGKIMFPSYISTQCRDLIKKLCVINPAKRLGMLKGGVSDIKKHPWFKGIDFEALEKRLVTPPFSPPLQGPADTCCFDEYELDSEHPGAGHVGRIRLPSMGVFKSF